MGEDMGYNGGSVINVASMAGFNVGTSTPAYAASKSAVLAMSRAFGVRTVIVETFSKYDIGEF